MEVTNIKDQPERKQPAWILAKWVGLWLVLYLVLGVFAGMFASGPTDVPTGMSWVNAADASSSTFYILRGGQHLILELNPHSLQWVSAILTGTAVLFVVILRQALRGRLKDRGGRPLSRWAQGFVVLMSVGMVVLMLRVEAIGLRKQVLDFDPAADTVTLNGEDLSSFKQLSEFRYYTTRGSKGSTDYHLVMDIVGQPERPIGGLGGHSDLNQAADYLNRYLAQARQTGQ